MLTLRYKYFVCYVEKNNVKENKTIIEEWEDYKKL